jgi:hypothetical protein
VISWPELFSNMATRWAEKRLLIPEAVSSLARSLEIITRWVLRRS